MSARSPTAPLGTALLENLAGLLAILFALVTPFLRPLRKRWGATEEEVIGPHPGDGLVPDPQWTATHAVTIDAPPERVWPWVVQVGQGRGGFYSYQRLENLAGCKIVNTDRVLAEHQTLREGDPIRLHADIPPMSVAIVDAPRALVLFGNPSGDDDPVGLSSTWAFLLRLQPDGATRLLSRTRYHHGKNLQSRLMGGPLLIEPLSFVMEKKMLRVIKRLAEGEGLE